MRNDLTQKLLLETTLRDGEIDDCGLGAQLRREAGIGQSAGQEHLEVLIEVHITTGDLDGASALFPDNLFFEHRVENRIDFILNTLDDQGLSVLQAEFQEPVLEFRVSEGTDGSSFLHIFGILL